MCDNCAPNTYKLKERLRHWYGALTTDTGEKLREQQVREDEKASQLINHIYSESQKDHQQQQGC